MSKIMDKNSLPMPCFVDSLHRQRSAGELISRITELVNEGNYYHHLFQKYDKKEIEEALEMIQKAGGYSFNRSHSHSYSAIGFQMMFLKCYYRKYFNVAILNTEGTDEKKGMPKIRKTLQDCMKNKKEKFLMQS